MKKPTLFWIDWTVATRESELPSPFAERFEIRNCINGDQPEPEIETLEPAAICIDFDYPDRRRLMQFVALKQRYAAIPMLMLTLQHSETLAIWAYRNGALDYFVKPVPEKELGRCIDRILEIERAKAGRDRQRLPVARSPLPHDIPAASRSKSAKLAPAIYYVQQYFNKRIYSGAVARLCDMSASHFSRAFKQTFDITFQDFLLRYRVAEACRQLRMPGVSITDVAYAVGFTDASYFTRVFSRYVGVSPSVYCKQAETTDNEVLLQEIAGVLDEPSANTARPAEQVG